MEFARVSKTNTCAEHSSKCVGGGGGGVEGSPPSPPYDTSRPKN